MSDIFQRKDLSCSNCLLETKVKNKSIKRIEKSDFYYKQGTGDVLIVLDCIEQKDDISKLKNFLKIKGINDYTLISGIKCRTQSYEVPNPIYKVYSECNTIRNRITDDTKVIITIAKGIFAVTQSDDLSSWQEFVELNFNQTYFYTRYKDRMIRVYPLPFLTEIFDFSSFENLYTINQLNKVKKYLEDNLAFLNEYKVYPYEKFIEPIKVIVDNPNEFLKQNMEPKECALDTETNSLNTYIKNFKVGCLTLTFDGITGYYLDFSKINLRLLERFLSNKYQVWSNCKYDDKSLNRMGITGVRYDEDIPLLYHMLNTERQSNSIKSLVYLIGLGGYDKELEDYKEKYNIENYLDIPQNILAPYAILDPIVTFRLYELAKYQLVPKQPEIYKTYKEIILPVIPVYKKIEDNGIMIDKEYLSYFNKKLLEDIEILKKEIYTILGKEINIGSGDELGAELERLGLPDYGRVKKGFYQTGDEVFQLWKKDGYEIADKILKFKSLTKLNNTFVGDIKKEKEIDVFNYEKQNDKEQGIVKHIQRDGKVHSNFGPGMTNSGRSFSNNPNFQNLPKQDEIAKEYRKIFKCEDDWYYMGVDYSGFQLRIAAIYSKDPVMKDIFINKNGDLHNLTSFSIFFSNKYMIEIELENGDKLKFYEKDIIKILRNNEILMIEAKYIQETDEIL